jgi:hypothetical protein
MSRTGQKPHAHTATAGILRRATASPSDGACLVPRTEEVGQTPSLR